MRIVHVHDRPLAGMPYRLEVAQRQYWTDAEIVRLQLAGPDADSAMGFPAGLATTADPPAAIDVVHLHQLVALQAASSLFPSDMLRRARVVLTIHGDPDRRAGALIPDWVDAVTVVTPELLPLYPGAVFIPNFALPETASLVRTRPRNGRPVLYRWSGYRDDKATGFAQLVQRLGSAWSVVDESPQLRSHSSILGAMSAADVCWDHLNGYWGLTSIEAIALGTLPIVRLTQPVLAALLARLGCKRVPFISGELDEIANILLALVADRDKLREHQAFAAKFARRYWSCKRILGWYREVYEQ